MKAVTSQVTHIHCPACNARDSTIDHVLSGETKSFGPWYCDTCGVGYRGTLCADGTIDVELTGEYLIETIALLEMPPQDRPVHLAVKGRFFSADKDAVPSQDQAKYYYNTHTCPTNYLRDAVSVVIADDDDPHGLFQFRVAVRKDKAPMTTPPPSIAEKPRFNPRALIHQVEHAQTEVVFCHGTDLQVDLMSDAVMVYVDPDIATRLSTIPLGKELLGGLLGISRDPEFRLDLEARYRRGRKVNLRTIVLQGRVLQSQMFVNFSEKHVPNGHDASYRLVTALWAELLDRSDATFLNRCCKYYDDHHNLLG